MPDLSKSAQEGLVEFFTLDTTVYGGGISRFCNSRWDGVSEIDRTEVTWGGQAYISLPFESTGWKRGGDRPERPKIVVPDFDGVLFSMLRAMDGAPGAPIVRIQALAADVLANNVNGAISTESYLLNKVSGNASQLTLELSTMFDFGKTKFPSFICTRETRPGLGSALLR